MVVSFGKFHFANVKPQRVQSYLRFLARAAADMKKKGRLHDVRPEDPRIISIRRAEDRFEHEIAQRMDALEEQISKTLQRINTRLQTERRTLLEQKAQLDAPPAHPRGKVSMQPAHAPRQRAQIEQRIKEVDDAHRLLAEALHLRSRVVHISERLLWLRRRGFDSASLHRLDQRIYGLKDTLYAKISSLVQKVEA